MLMWDKAENESRILYLDPTRVPVPDSEPTSSHRNNHSRNRSPNSSC